MNVDFQFFPEAASTVAGSTDALYFFLLAVAGFFTALICFLVLFFGTRYRKNAKRPRTAHAPSLFLEVAWSVIPLALTMVMFLWGAVLFSEMHHVPPNAMTVQVVGKQWMWKLQHPDGRREINTLHVPVGKPVRLNMISEDVIHSFYVPAFRLKQDVLPGRYTSLWFEATKVGEFHLFCAEYCGADHSRMIGRVIVQEPADYVDWTTESTAETAVVQGRRLFERFRCDDCHQKETTSRAPSLIGLFGRTIPLSGGGEIIADEVYVRDSILNPQAKQHAGFQAVMPSYQGQLNEEDVLQIITWLQTLSEAAPPTETEEE